MKAGERVDVQEVVLRGRAIPCICADQFDEASNSRGVAYGHRIERGSQLVERVHCSAVGCSARWVRITVRGKGEIS